MFPDCMKDLRSNSVYSSTNDLAKILSAGLAVALPADLAVRRDNVTTDNSTVTGALYVQVIDGAIDDNSVVSALDNDAVNIPLHIDNVALAVGNLDTAFVA
ncbi:hypothetical protein BGZ81_007019 [Podila clonocystis]|nr:hypothetical protein BGZ81_007019 [Podila clonocystis]